MSEILRSAKSQLEAAFSGNGLIQTPIKWLSVYKFDADTAFSGVYEPSLCVILSGSKSVQMGASQAVSYACGDVLFVATHLPSLVRINAPYLALKITPSPQAIASVLTRVKLDLPASQSQNAVVKTELTDELISAVSRLVGSLKKDAAARDFLAQLVLDEIIFILLNSQASSLLKSVFAMGGVEAKIARASKIISSEYANKIDLARLSRELDMSQSSFNSHFKRITTLTPAEF